MWTDHSEDEQNHPETTSRKRSSRGKLNLLFPRGSALHDNFQRAINVGKLKANANDKPRPGTQSNVKAAHLPGPVRDFFSKLSVLSSSLKLCLVACTFLGFTAPYYHQLGHCLRL